MKKVLMFIGLSALCLAGAAEFDSKKIEQLCAAGDFAGCETYLLSTTASVKEKSAEQIKLGRVWQQNMSYVLHLSYCRAAQKKYADATAVVTDVKAIAATVGLTDIDTIQQSTLNALVCVGYILDGYNLSATWTGTKTAAQKGRICVVLSKWDEAVTHYTTAGNWSAVYSAAKAAKNPVKIFEGATKCLESGSYAQPAKMIEMIETVVVQNFTGTTVTSQQVKDFLIMCNRKYSRHLTSAKKDQWEPVISLIRTTLLTF